MAPTPLSFKTWGEGGVAYKDRAWPPPVDAHQSATTKAAAQRDGQVNAAPALVGKMCSNFTIINKLFSLFSRGPPAMHVTGRGVRPPKPQTPLCVTFRLVVAPLRGPGQSTVLPFTCCVRLLLSVGRCGWCSCGCRFRVRGAQ